MSIGLWIRNLSLISKILFVGISIKNIVDMNPLQPYDRWLQKTITIIFRNNNPSRIIDLLINIFILVSLLIIY